MSVLQICSRRFRTSIRFKGWNSTTRLFAGMLTFGVRTSLGRPGRCTGPTGREVRGIEVAKNGYRVLLTRARKGMILFVPRADTSGEDSTRDSRFYESVASFLARCGANPI